MKTTNQNIPLTLRRSSWLQPVSIAPICILAAVQFAIILFFNTRERWIDEYTTHWAIQGSWAGLLERVRLSQGNSALYYLLLREWYLVFGDSAFSGRAMASIGIFGGLALLFLALTRDERMSKARITLVLLVLILVQTNDELIFYATNDRAYGFAFLMLCIFSLLTRAGLAGVSARRGIGIISSAIGCVLLHPSTLPVVLSGLLILFVYRALQNEKLYLLLLYGTTFSIILCLFYYLGRFDYHDHNLSLLQLTRPNLLGLFQGLLSLPLICCLTGGLLSYRQAGLWLAMGVILSPLLSSLLLSLYYDSGAPLAPRYLGWSLLGYALLATESLLSPSARRLKILGLTILLTSLYLLGPAASINSLIKGDNLTSKFGYSEQWAQAVETVCLMSPSKPVLVWAGLAEQVVTSPAHFPALDELVTWPALRNRPVNCSSSFRALRAETDCSLLRGQIVLFRQGPIPFTSVCRGSADYEIILALTGLSILRLK